MQKQKLLRINEIKFDKELYPRNSYAWNIVQKYKLHLKNGANFPPIKVWLHKNKHYLIDGKHRIEAYKQLKREYIQSIVYNFKTSQEAYIESVKSNMQHGLQFSAYDTTKIILRLRDFKLDDNLISKIVQMPLDNMTRFIGKRVIITSTGETHPLKAQFKHLSTKYIEDNEIKPLSEINESKLETEQEYSYMPSQHKLIEECAILLENPTLIKKDNKMKKLLKRLYTAIKKLKVVK